MRSSGFPSLLVLGMVVVATLSSAPGTLFASELWPITTDTLVGDFEQRIDNEYGQRLSTSRGRFALQKPRLFRWEIQDPGRQTFVSDGESLWQQDFDLETSSVDRLDHESSSPLELLMASEGALTSRFDISRVDGVLTLAPKQEGDLFESVTLRDIKNGRHEMIIIDGLQQRIVITLTVDPTAAPAPGAFVIPDSAYESS